LDSVVAKVLPLASRTQVKPKQLAVPKRPLPLKPTLKQPRKSKESNKMPSERQIQGGSPASQIPLRPASKSLFSGTAAAATATKEEICVTVDEEVEVITLPDESTESTATASDVDFVGQPLQPTALFYGEREHTRDSDSDRELTLI